MIVTIVLLSRKIDIKEMSLDSMYKKPNKFNDEITRLNNINPRKKKHKRIKE